MKEATIMRNMPKNIEKIVREFVNQANELLGDRIKKIILYGSYARGDYKKNSDVDLMILTDLSDDEIIEFREKLSDIAFEIEFENNFDVMLSPLLKNIDKFNYWLEALPFYMNVEKEGVVLSES